MICFYYESKTHKNISVNSGELLPYKINVPTRKGYGINGFYYNSSFNENKVYNADGTFNNGNRVTTRNIAKDITLYYEWHITERYYFIIDKIHIAGTEGVTMDRAVLPYDGYYTYTAPDTYTIVNADRKSVV